MNWRRFLFSARTRILAWLAVLTILSVVVSILIIRQILYTLLEQRVEQSLLQEVAELNRLVKGRNPVTGKLFGDDVAAIFDVFLVRSVPDNDEYLITLLNDQIYRTSPITIPEELRQNKALIQQWSQLKRAQRGKFETPTDTFLYLAQPVVTTGENQGIFVVADSITNKQHEVNLAVLVAASVIFVVLIVALFLAWLATGKVLAPLSLLTETARSIIESEKNLNRRIPIQGTDEIAELTITFNQMLNQLESSFASQRDFINDASHELQTPLTVIQGHLEILSDDPQEREETLALVTDELGRMSRFVGDLLLLARSERPDFLTLELVEVKKLIEEVYAKAVAIASRHWQIKSVVSIRIVADRHRLTQVMMNLIKNAVEHTTSSDTIELGAKLIDKHIHLWVRDTGIGIAARDQERIFKRFARVSHSRRRSEGAGLGLSIVDAIAKAHGGYVEVHSLLSKGSTFTVIIPLEPLHEVVSDESHSHRRR